jgi:hypothetical protein
MLSLEICSPNTQQTLLLETCSPNTHRSDCQRLRAFGAAPATPTVNLATYNPPPVSAILTLGFESTPTMSDLIAESQNDWQKADGYG